MLKMKIELEKEWMLCGGWREEGLSEASGVLNGNTANWIFWKSFKLKGKKDLHEIGK